MEGSGGSWQAQQQGEGDRKRGEEGSSSRRISGDRRRSYTGGQEHRQGIEKAICVAKGTPMSGNLVAPAPLAGNPVPEGDRGCGYEAECSKFENGRLRPETANLERTSLGSNGVQTQLMEHLVRGGRDGSATGEKVGSNADGEVDAGVAEGTDGGDVELMGSWQKGIEGEDLNRIVFRVLEVNSSAHFDWECELKTVGQDSPKGGGTPSQVRRSARIQAEVSQPVSMLKKAIKTKENKTSGKKVVRGSATTALGSVSIPIDGSAILQEIAIKSGFNIAEAGIAENPSLREITEKLHARGLSTPT